MFIDASQIFGKFILTKAFVCCETVCLKRFERRFVIKGVLSCLIYLLINFVGE